MYENTTLTALPQNNTPNKSFFDDEILEQKKHNKESQKNKENIFKNNLKKHDRSKSDMQTMAFIEPQEQNFFMFSPTNQTKNFSPALSIDEIGDYSNENFSFFEDSFGCN